MKFLAALFFCSTACFSAPSKLNWGELPPSPDPVGFAGPVAGVADGVVIMAGGANFPAGYPWDGGKKVFHDRIFVLTDPHQPWKLAATKLPKPVAYAASVSLPQRSSLLYLGGNDAEGATAAVIELSWKLGAVCVGKEIPPLPVPSTLGSAAVVRDSIIFASGETKGVTHKKCFCLDLMTQPFAWKELPWPADAPGRILAIAGSSKDNFYLFSGCDLSSPMWDKRTYLKDAYKLHLPSQKWTRLADLPESAAAAPSLAIPQGETKLLLLGGSNRSFVEAQRSARPATDGNGLAHPGFPTHIYAYDMSANTWEKIGDVPAPAPVTTTSFLWRGQHVVPSGEVKPGIRTPKILTLGF